MFFFYILSLRCYCVNLELKYDNWIFCITDDETVLKFWIDVKERSGTRVNIICDYITESNRKKEIDKYTWLTYGVPLHRLRGSVHTFVTTVDIGWWIDNFGRYTGFWIQLKCFIKTLFMHCISLLWFLSLSIAALSPFFFSFELFSIHCCSLSSFFFFFDIPCPLYVMRQIALIACLLTSQSISLHFRIWNKYWGR